MSRNIMKTKPNKHYSKSIYRQFAYPVTIIPIRYWAVKETEHNIIGTTILKLLQLRPYTLSSVKKLMGMEKTFSKVIEQEWNRLIIHQYILQVDGKADFWKANEDLELVEYKYEDGFLCFDEMYGRIMPYIFPGTPNYEFRSVPYETIVLQNTINLTKALFDSIEFKNQVEHAVIQFNTYLLNKIKSGDGQLNESEIQLVVDGTNIENWRVELKTFGTLRQAYLPVDVTGEIVVGLNKRIEPRLFAYSPFTNEKSHYFLDILKDISKSKTVLDELTDLIQIAEEDKYAEDFGVSKDVIDESLEQIVEKLEGKQLSYEATFELLQNAEYEFLQYERDGERLIGGRHNKVNNWYLILESLLRPKISEMEEIQWPTNWRYHGKEMDAFLNLQTQGIQIPKSLFNNIRNVFEEGQKKPLNKIRANGARDLLAIIIIADLIRKQSRKETVLLSKIYEQPDILERMDALIVWRNQRGAHVDMHFYDMPSDLFFKELTKHREMVYDVLKLFP